MREKLAVLVSSGCCKKDDINIEVMNQLYAIGSKDVNRAISRLEAYQSEVTSMRLQPNRPRPKRLLEFLKEKQGNTAVVKKSVKLSFHKQPLSGTAMFQAKKQQQRADATKIMNAVHVDEQPKKKEKRKASNSKVFDHTPKDSLNTSVADQNLTSVSDQAVNFPVDNVAHQPPPPPPTGTYFQTPNDSRVDTNMFSSSSQFDSTFPFQARQQMSGLNWRNDDMQRNDWQMPRVHQTQQYPRPFNNAPTSISVHMQPGGSSRNFDNNWRGHNMMPAQNFGRPHFYPPRPNYRGGMHYEQRFNPSQRYPRPSRGPRFH